MCACSVCAGYPSAFLVVVVEEWLAVNTTTIYLAPEKGIEGALIEHLSEIDGLEALGCMYTFVSDMNCCI